MNSKDILVSAGALMVIAGVVTAALAGTNALTEGVIARRAEETENAARRQVIDADSFERPPSRMRERRSSIISHRRTALP